MTGAYKNYAGIVKRSALRRSQVDRLMLKKIKARLILRELLSEISWLIVIILKHFHESAFPENHMVTSPETGRQGGGVKRFCVNQMFSPVVHGGEPF